jgi:hypothetical protein
MPTASRTSNREATHKWSCESGCKNLIALNVVVRFQCFFCLYCGKRAHYHHDGPLTDEQMLRRMGYVRTDHT